MSKKKQKRRGNGANTNHGSGLLLHFSRYLQNPLVVIGLIASALFMLTQLFFLNRATSINNINSCVSNCTFNN